MHMKMCIHYSLHYSLLRRLASYKVCLCVYRVVRFCIVPHDCYFCWYQIFMDFVKFLYMIIYEVLGVVFKV